MIPYTPAIEAALVVLCFACGVGMFAAEMNGTGFSDFLDPAPNVRTPGAAP